MNQVHYLPAPLKGWTCLDAYIRAAQKTAKSDFVTYKYPNKSLNGMIPLAVVLDSCFDWKPSSAPVFASFNRLSKSLLDSDSYCV